MEVYYGLFTKELWRDKKSGSTLFSMSVKKDVPNRDLKYGTIVVFAKIPSFPKDFPLQVSGEWKTTDKGVVFESGSVIESASEDVSIIPFLSGIDQIGQSRAVKIAEAFGTAIFAEMCRAGGTEKVMKACKGIQEQAARNVCRAIKSIVYSRKLLDFILSHGGSYQCYKRAMNEYGDSAIQTIRKNPYNAGHLCGLTFRQCDLIALENGVERLSSERISAAAVEAIRQGEKNGDCFMREYGFLAKTLSLMQETSQVSVPGSVISSAVYRDNRFVVEEDLYGLRIYSKYMMRAECGVAYNVSRLIRTGYPLPYKKEYFDEVEKEIGVKYAPQQKEAFNLLKKTGIAIVTGGPGTGKTTVINGIIKAYKKMCPTNTIRLCAPTGRASQRMTESTGEEAVTVHRLLDYRPYGNDVSYKDSRNPIEADFIICDEASMLDTEIANLLLSAVKNGSLMLFVGDVDQLQAVGPGDVLHNLIYSDRVDVYKLTEVYRQAKTSPIVQNAIRINEGDDDLICDDSFDIRYRLPEQFKEEIIEAVKRLHDSNDPFATQVLAPTHKGDFGIQSLNACLQDMLNPKSSSKKELRYGKSVFREGDKVVFVVNRYESHYHNGDIGIISSIENGTINVKICGSSEVSISEDMIEDLNLAYAMSVHKSQGSEFQTVIMSLPYKPEIMLKRNLLYTGITRAKNRLVLICENGSISRSVATNETGKRNTALMERLQSSIFEGGGT